MAATSVNDPNADTVRSVGLFRAMGRHFVSIATAILVGAVVGYALSSQQDSTYEAESRIFFSATYNFDPLSNAQPPNNPDRHIANQADVITSTQVLERAGTIVGRTLTSPEARERITAQPNEDGDVVVISAEADSARGAQRIADAVGQAYREHVAAQVAETVEEVQQALGAFTDPDELDQLRVEAAIYGDGVGMVEAAALPRSAARPLPTRDGLILGVLAGLIAAGVAVYREERPRMATSAGDIADRADAMVLGTVPRTRRAPASASLAVRPGSDTAIVYDEALVALDYILAGRRASTVLVASPTPSWERTFSAANLALAAARDGRLVALADADDRGRTLTDSAAPAAERGLADMAEPGMDLQRTSVRWPSDQAFHLPFVPAVRQDGVAAPKRDECLSRAIEALAKEVDFLVIDGPPLLTSSDALPVLFRVDGVVLVLAHSTSKVDLDLARRRLERVGVPLLGVIVHDTSAKSFTSRAVRSKRRKPHVAPGTTDESPAVAEPAVPIRSGSAQGSL